MLVSLVIQGTRVERYLFLVSVIYAAATVDWFRREKKKTPINLLEDLLWCAGVRSRGAVGNGRHAKGIS